LTSDGEGEGRCEAPFKDDEMLALFVDAMRKFDHEFNEAMVGLVDFTITLEVRGDKGEILHCNTRTNEYRRPKKVQAEVEQKRRLPGPH